MQAGFAAIACFCQGAAQIGFGVGIFRIQPNGGPKVDESLSEIALRGQGVAEIVVRVEVVWASFQRGGQMRDGFGGAIRGE